MIATFKSAQSVIYTEVRYSPHLLADGGLLVGGADRVISESEKESADAIVAAVTAGLRRGEEQFGVTVNQILCCLAFRPDWAVS
jgi:adenosine deaminase